MMRINTSCHYAIKRKGGEKVLVTAMNRKECSSSVNYIRLNEPVTDPADLKKAEADGKKAAKILEKTQKTTDGKHRRRSGLARMVDPGLPDPTPETPAKAEAKAPPVKKAANKKLTDKQKAARAAARKKAAAKKAAAREESAKREAAAAAAEA